MTSRFLTGALRLLAFTSVAVSACGGGDEGGGGGEEGDVDVGELVDEPQPETGASGTAGSGDEAGEGVGRSGAGVVHADHDSVDAVPGSHGDGPPAVQVCVDDGFGDGD